MPRTVCIRLLRTLELEGLVERDSETGRYRLGLELFRLGSAALHRTDLRSAAARPMAALARATGDVVCLMVESDLQSLCIERVDGDYPIRNLTVDVGLRKPLHYGAASFALLSFLPEEKIERILSQPLDAPTPYTIVDPDTIRARIQEVRRLGYAVSDQDSVEHTAAVGAPIFGYQGEVVAALSAGGPKHRYPPERIPEVAALVMSTAAEISRRLGYVSQPAGGAREPTP